MAHRFRSLAGGHRVQRRAETGGFQRANQRFPVKWRHRFIADDRGAASLKSGSDDEFAGALQGSGFDDDVVRALGEIDMDGGHALSMKKPRRMSIPDHQGQVHPNKPLPQGNPGRTTRSSADQDHDKAAMVTRSHGFDGGHIC